MRTVVTALAVAGVVLSAACGAIGRAKETLTDLFTVQQAVQRRVGSAPVRVNLMNGVRLTVNIVNSPFHDLPAAPKKAKALELAKVAYDAYPERRRLASVQVVFLIDSTHAFFFHYRNGLDAHSFTREDLDTAAPPGPPGAPPT